MKHLLLFLTFLATGITFAQTDYQIDAQAMSWSNPDITIELGDSITWINSNNGTHNINGTTTTFTSNPESFGMLTTGANWTFGKRFNVPGVYLYRCDVHSSVMFGKVTVVDPALSVPTKKTMSVSIYPNPAQNVITLNASATRNKVVIYDMLGNMVMSQVLENQNTLDISKLTSGVYLVEISSTDGISKMKLVKK